MKNFQKLINSFIDSIYSGSFYVYIFATVTGNDINTMLKPGF